MYIESLLNKGWEHNRLVSLGVSWANNRNEIIAPDINTDIVQTNQMFPPGSIDGAKIGSIVDTGNAGIVSLNDTENPVDPTNPLRFWAGDDFANRYTADFRVYKDGSVFASNATIAGTIVASAINIPDAVSANSFHVDSMGNTWWGANVADFTADPNNAPAYVLNNGFAKFSNVIVNGRTLSVDPIFGDGSDGNVTIPAGTTTLTRDMFYDQLIINGTLKPNGYKVFCKASISGSATGKIDWSGGDGGDGGVGTNPSGGAGGTAGTAGNSAGSLPAANSGKTGGHGQNNTGAGGTPGVSGTNVTSALGSAGANGGAGGNNSVGNGGQAGATGGTIAAFFAGIRNVINSVSFIDTGSDTGNLYRGSGGAASGGGGGEGVNFGGGGGGASGGDGGFGLICAPTQTYAAGFVFDISGGDGGDGGASTGGTAGGGGGGGGGSGGFFVRVFVSLDDNSTILESGGVKGVGGVGFGGGFTGANGQNGNVGGHFDFQYD